MHIVFRRGGETCGHGGPWSSGEIGGRFQAVTGRADRPFHLRWIGTARLNADQRGGFRINQFRFEIGTGDFRQSKQGKREIRSVAVADGR